RLSAPDNVLVFFQVRHVLEAFFFNARFGLAFGEAICSGDGGARIGWAVWGVYRRCICLAVRGRLSGLRRSGNSCGGKQQKRDDDRFWHEVSILRSGVNAQCCTTFLCLHCDLFGRCESYPALKTKSVTVATSCQMTRTGFSFGPVSDA